MEYRQSPFKEDFDVKMLLQQTSDVPNEMIQIQNDLHLKKLLKWLCTTPAVTSFRVNTLKFTVNEVQRLLADELMKKFAIRHNCKIPKIEAHPILSEVILLHNWDENNLDLKIRPKEVIVDVNCGAAVLRGAHIFAPGVMGMLSGTEVDDEVSIYADISGKCKKGLQRTYECPKKLFIGNGIVKMVRYELYGENLTPTGIAVEITDTISRCPSIGDSILPKSSALLQNLPSIICSYALQLQPSNIVLDMCAAPGNKTTHIAALMQNEGTLIAIDKTQSRVRELKATCEEFGARAHVFQADSTNILDREESLSTWNVLNGPPFPAEMFDRILLDAPCSGLGKRPQLSTNISEKVLKSYVPLQRKLFENAVHLLKPNGYIAYSTCTITLAENEGIVAWALRTFDCLELKKPAPYLGSPGLSGTTLTESQRLCVERFGPEQEIDSVGFFIALFFKKNTS